MYYTYNICTMVSTYGMRSLARRQVECLCQPGRGRRTSIGSHHYSRDKEVHTAVAWICKHQTALEAKMGTTYKDFSTAVGDLGNYTDHDGHLISAKQYEARKEMGQVDWENSFILNRFN